MHENDMLRCGK